MLHSVILISLFNNEIPKRPEQSIKLMLFPFSLEGSARIWLEKEPPIDFDMGIFDESFYEAWDRFNDLLRACPHHGFSELHQLDTFYNALNANDQDSLNSAAGGNFLDKMPRECLRIIERISPDVAALTTEVSELKNLMKTMLIDKQKAQAPASVKAVEQSCVTCGGAHSYKNCPATDGNVYQDNIQEYVSQAAAANFNQGNSNSRPPMVANQIRPPGFPPIQNNQNRFNPNQGNNFNQNRGTNFNQNRNFNQGQVYQPPTIQTPVYQAPTQQMQGVSKTDFENYVKANDAVLRNMQNQGQGLQNQMTNLTEMLSKFITSNTASSSNSGTLPSQTVTNPREHVNAITTRSGKTCEGPSTPLVPTPVVSTPSKEPEQNPETSIDRVQKPSSESTAQAKKIVQEPNSQDPDSYQPKLPYPKRMKQLGPEALTPTRMTLKLANRFVTYPMGIAEDVVVRVDGFTFLVDFVVVNFIPTRECAINSRKSFPSHRKRLLIDLYEENIDFRVGKGKNLGEDVEIKNSNIYNDLVLRQTPLSDKGECFDLGDDTDEIDAFLAMEISMDYEEGYYDSEGDVLFLKSWLCEDTTHNFSSKVIFDHDTSISFSPRSDPLHHEFAGEVITLPSRNDREFEEYLSLMTVLCEISTSRSQENVHANQSSIIESLPVSSIPVEDSEPVQEEIDIFLVPDDLIPPGVENDDSEDEDNELPNLDHQDDLSIPRPPPEPPDVEKCLEPEAG
ncbi:hypothetical protein Tco_1010621 [Tanacetum coccineum]